MRRGFALLAILCLVVAGSALARPSDQYRASQSLLPGEVLNDLPTSPRSTMRADTIWFGGLNVAEGIAYNSQDDGYEAAVWTWDNEAVLDTLEGWTCKDVTQDARTYFNRVVADSFTSHSDPYTPMFPAPSTAQIWNGTHEDEADALGWDLGMGYANESCQKATSPRFAITTGQDVVVSFKYFQDSEVDWDYTYVYLLTYDALDVLKQTREIARLTGKVGTYLVPANFASGTLAYGSFSPAPAKIELQFNFLADGAWSDEDGLYSCDYGPFSADDVHFVIGPTDHAYDFESGEQGWIFNRCPGVGAYMNVCTEAEWTFWTSFEAPKVRCECHLADNALNCATDAFEAGGDYPGHLQGHDEYMISSVVDREGFTSAAGWYNVVARMDAFDFLRMNAGTFYRPGFYYFPFTTPENLTERWSPRSGQEVWRYTGTSPICSHDRLVSLTVPPDGTPLPYYWEQMKLILEVITNCDNFGIEATDCKKEGITKGSPVYDNVRIGITGGVNAPPMVLETGHLFHDGFGQLSPYYLDPGDVCNSDVAYDHSRDNTDYNEWLEDTAAVNGPPVTLPEYTYWIELCFKVAQKGPRQDWIPGYTAWKARLTGDPEADFVCALMDTAMTLVAGEYIPKDEGQARVTFFHEDDPGFDPNFEDRTSEQEILPDLVFTPGTRIEYYWRSYWALNPSGYFEIPINAPSAGTYEMEFRPKMELDTETGDEYDVIWPSVLYVDAFNGGGEGFLVPVFDQLGIAFDKFDRVNFSSNYDAPMRRSLGLARYNPGGWGNNGCTLEQLMGYRLILWSAGTLGIGGGEINDFTLLEDWLATTDCGAAGFRRGLIFDGDELAEIMGDEDNGKALSFFTNVLGGEILNHSYRDHNNDDYACVWLEPVASPEFSPSTDITMFANGCPLIRDYNCLTPLSPTVGNLKFVPGDGAVAPVHPEVEYAQIVREVGAGGVGGYKTVVNGFSFHQMPERYYDGIECNDDSLAISAGCGDLFGPELTWMIDNGAAPFDKWHDPCPRTGVDEGGETHLSGPVNYLYHSQPNPFRNSATIRFNMASEGPVKIAIYDVSGRLIKTLHDGKAEAGEHSLTWDGTDNTGNPVNGGIFWMDMTTKTWESSKRVVLL
ncbi:MAG: FlgD immunoglobulin-like domain containing protein, partial [Candidatus Eisenbacteria bacterium]